MEKPAVNALISRLDLAALVSIFVVVAGLIGETFDFPHHEAGNLSVAGAVVTVGVLGEFIVHWLLRRTTARLEQITHAEESASQLEIAGLRRETERLRDRNALLKHFLMPRHVWIQSPREEALAALHGAPFDIHAVPDLEARKFAANLWNILRHFGWNGRVAREDEVHDPDSLPDGTEIVAPESLAAHKAALREFLWGCGIKTDTHAVKGRDAPADLIRIYIGMRPTGDQLVSLEALEKFGITDEERRKIEEDWGLRVPGR